MPQDANRLNRMQIREQEQLNRERRAQAEAEERRRTDAVKRSKNQYEHVRSHGYGVAAGGGRAGSGAVDDVEIRVFVQECNAANARSYTYRESEGSAVAAAERGAAPPPQQQRLPPVQRAPRQVGGGSAGLSMGRGGAQARAVPSVGGGSLSGPDAGAPSKGRVPRYLVQRKAEMAAEKEAVEAEAERRREQARIPPGHRLVSEEEKADKLASLEARQQELEMQLGKIPIRFDTQAIRTRRGNIEEELRDIEATKIKYSTKKPLYIPLS